MPTKFDLTEALRLLKGGRLAEAASGLRQHIGAWLHPHAEPPLAAAPTIVRRTWSGPPGSRPYTLCIPANLPAGGAPLIVMLHGCTQTPDDFAAGTRMNEAAARHGCLVAWPGQVRKANLQRCWNWFDPASQTRDSGEAAIVAGIVREIAGEWPVDRGRVYVAGLSAGGALAANVAQAYPDLFAAAGVHSGLACGAARDLSSAVKAMAGGAPGTPRSRPVPTIVFHGDLDATVNARNADAVIAQALAGAPTTVETKDALAPGCHPWTRTVHRDATGAAIAEAWRIHGGGHAWSGGSPAGSFTDPLGPDASAEMLRFFLRHTLPT